MKRILSAILLCAALAVPAFADPSRAEAKKSTTTIKISGKPATGPMGIGIFLGQPAGLTFEIDLSSSSWIDFKAAWDLAGGNSGYSIQLQGNYEYAFPGMIAIEAETLTPFFGAGAFVTIYDGGISLGARAPGGVSYRFRTIPLELFLEIGLDVYLFPGFDIGASGGLGARYRF
ncbi:MAG: hypothetical protein KKB59_07550 [Spirochaetes bacterium]|nr:hypothetical protein [Spirochaetota bacterium]